MAKPEYFKEAELPELCNLLATRHPVFKKIISVYGYPPFWSRKPTFETLVHIILEQQVSLNSALAALNKLKQVLPEVTPDKFLLLTDETLRNCYLSRQKIVYTKHLATLLLNNTIILDELYQLPDEIVCEILQRVKGIGKWTAKVFLMMCLHRTDVFPMNDIALIKSIIYELQLPATTSNEQIGTMAQSWQPLRTVAAFMLWHAYLCRRNS